MMRCGNILYTMNKYLLDVVGAMNMAIYFFHTL